MRNDPYKTPNLQSIQCCAKPDWNTLPIKYNNIARGTTVKIPVSVRTADGEPINLSGYTVYFTLKAKKGDMIYDDSTALIQRTFEPQDPTNGKFYVVLSARETWLVPSFYYFDFELQLDDSVVRLGNFVTQIIDGTTNRSIVSASNSASVVSVLDDIIINKGIADNIIVVSNFLAQGSSGEGVPEIPSGVNKEYIRARDADGQAYWKEHTVAGDTHIFVLPPTTYTTTVVTVSCEDIVACGIPEEEWRENITHKKYPEVHFYNGRTLLVNEIRFTENSDVVMIVTTGQGDIDGSTIRMVLIWQPSKITTRETYSVRATVDDVRNKVYVSASDLSLAGINMTKYLRALANYEFPEVHFYQNTQSMILAYEFEYDGAISAVVDPADITGAVRATLTVVV